MAVNRTPAFLGSLAMLSIGALLLTPSANALEVLSTTSSASASSGQFSFDTQSNSGSDGAVAAASASSTYTSPVNGGNGSGSAAAVANPVAGTVGAYATGTSDVIGKVFGVPIPGTIISTATATITGSVTFGSLSSATYLPILFDINGTTSGRNYSISSVLTVWVNDPTGLPQTGLASCPTFGSSSCYSITYNNISTVFGDSKNAVLSANWRSGDSLSYSAGGGLSFDADILLPAGAADTVTVYDTITVTASNGSTADFLDPQTLGFDTSHNNLNYTPDDNFLGDPVSVPEPGSLVLMGSAIMGLALLRRARSRA